ENDNTAKLQWDAAYDLRRFLKPGDMPSLTETTPAIAKSGQQLRFLTFCPDASNNYTMRVTALDANDEPIDYFEDDEMKLTATPGLPPPKGQVTETTIVPKGQIGKEAEQGAVKEPGLEAGANMQEGEKKPDMGDITREIMKGDDEGVSALDPHLSFLGSHAVPALEILEDVGDRGPLRSYWQGINELPPSLRDSGPDMEVLMLRLIFPLFGSDPEAVSTVLGPKPIADTGRLEVSNSHDLRAPLSSILDDVAEAQREAISTSRYILALQLDGLMKGQISEVAQRQRELSKRGCPGSLSSPGLGVGVGAAEEEVIQFAIRYNSLLDSSMGHIWPAVAEALDIAENGAEEKAYEKAVARLSMAIRSLLDLNEERPEPPLKRARSDADAEAQASPGDTSAVAGQSSPADSIAPARCVCVMLLGMRGSGKTSVCSVLHEVIGGIHIHYDGISASSTKRGSRKTYARELRAALARSLAATRRKKGENAEAQKPVADGDNLLLIDRTNILRSQRADAIAELQRLRWHKRGCRTMLVEFSHPNDEMGYGLEGQLSKRYGESHIGLCAGRIEQRGCAHHALKPSARLRTVLQKEAKAMEPILPDEQRHFDSQISVDVSAAPPDVATEIVKDPETGAIAGSFSGALHF
ncbi:unnamed protein product, partial [Symbiodinium necroappetens]